MTARTVLGASSCWFVVLLGCSQGTTQGATAPPRDQSGTTGGFSSDDTATSSSTDQEETPHPLADDRPPDPSRALPELTYSHLGMHIGGESNTPESKRPWLEDIERSIESILACYRLVDDPKDGGSYGVDLYVGSEGGKAEVRASRQKLGGREFDDCMRKAFSSVVFHDPERPTVLSYSILFSLED